MCHGNIDPSILMRDAAARTAHVTVAASKDEKTASAISGLRAAFDAIRAMLKQKGTRHV
jgi:hypothetical protein